MGNYYSDGNSNNKNAIGMNRENRNSVTSFAIIAIAMVALITTALPLPLAYSKTLSLAQLMSQPIASTSNNNPFLKFLTQQQLQSLLLPNDASSIDSNLLNNVQLTALTPSVFSSVATTTVLPFIPTTPPTITNPAIITAPATINPSLVASSQIPFIQGSSTNGFVSLLCSSNTIQTPSPSALSFQASTYGAINSLLFPTTSSSASIPVTGRIILSNSLGGPIFSGQINSGQATGNSFTLQGVLTGASIPSTSSGGLNGLCSTLASIGGAGGITSAAVIPSLSAFSNQFTISGTCGTNVPVAFTIDRIVVGAYIANISCNGIA
jgi:hypothetical protein